MSLGFSITELLEALKKCQDVYKAFASEYGNAPRQFTAFKDELDRVDQALRVQEQINSWTGQAYPGTVAFRDVLDESRHFAEKQKRVIDRSKGDGGLIGILQTALSAFEKELPRLQDRLSHNRIELVSFNVTLLLQKSFNGVDRSSASAGALRTTAEHGLPEDKSRQVEQVLMKLFRVGNVYRRLSNTAVQVPGSPITKPENLDADFENCIASLCALVGLPTHHLASISADDISGHLSEDWWQSVIQSSSQISHHNTAAFLEPHVARICRTKVKIEGSGFTAYSYVIFKRCCYWRDEQGLVVLEHKLTSSTRKCFPYTQHRMFDTPLMLSFLELQDVVIKTANDRKLSCKPQYTFATESDYTTFQSDLRGRELLHEFHVTSIGSKNSRGGADAHNEVIKVWDAPAGSVDRTISFPAALASSSTKDYELPLKWFSPPVTPMRSANVRLELTTEPSRRSSSAKTSSIKPKFMRKDTAVPGGSVNSADSIRSVNTNIAQSFYAPAEYIVRVGYLDIKFASASAIPGFLSAIAEPFAPATPASTFTGAPPSLYSGSSPSTLGTSWTGSPFSFQSVTRRPVPNRTSTSGTSPMSPSTLLQLPGAAMDKPVPVMDRPADEFALPAAEAGLSGLMLRPGEDLGPAMAVPQTPSSLLHDSRNTRGGKNGSRGPSD